MVVERWFQPVDFHLILFTETNNLSLILFLSDLVFLIIVHSRVSNKFFLAIMSIAISTIMK